MKRESATTAYRRLDVNLPYMGSSFLKTESMNTQVSSFRGGDGLEFEHTWGKQGR